MPRDPNIGACALCLEVRPLCESHIISRFVVAKLKDEFGSFYDLEGPTNARVRRVQDALKERLLCVECEGRLHPSEKYVAEFLAAGSLPAPRHGYAMPCRAEYAPFKLFQLSVLWRMHVAKGPAFAHVDLGPAHAERLRRRLLASDPGPPTEYPCAVSRLYLDGKLSEAVVLPPPTREREGGHHVYWLLYAGLKCHYVVSSHAADHWASHLAIRRDGTFNVQGCEIRGSRLEKALAYTLVFPNWEQVDRMKARREARRGSASLESGSSVA